MRRREYLKYAGCGGGILLSGCTTEGVSKENVNKEKDLGGIRGTHFYRDIEIKNGEIIVTCANDGNISGDSSFVLAEEIALLYDEERLGYHNFVPNQMKYRFPKSGDGHHSVVTLGTVFSSNGDGKQTHSLNLNFRISDSEITVVDIEKTTYTP